jgi:hypothetical protein
MPFSTLMLRRFPKRAIGGLGPPIPSCGARNAKKGAGWAGQARRWRDFESVARFKYLFLDKGLNILYASPPSFSQEGEMSTEFHDREKDGGACGLEIYSRHVPGSCGAGPWALRPQRLQWLNHAWHQRI